jgi:hypothetical protein
MHPGDLEGSLLIETTNDVLAVGNPGQPISTDVLLYSIGLVGETTKETRRSIGHKGVGIKAILEITDAPEIYSRASASGPFDLQVQFDRDRALDHVRGRTGPKQWTGWLKSLPGIASARGEERVPLLSFPF